MQFNLTVDSRASNSDGFETRVKRSAIADKQDCRAASNPEYVYDFQPMFAEVDAEFQDELNRKYSEGVMEIVLTHRLHGGILVDLKGAPVRT